MQVAAGSVDFPHDRSWFDRRWVEGLYSPLTLWCRGDFGTRHGRNRCPYGCDRSDADLAEAKFRKGKKRFREGESRCREGESGCAERASADAKKDRRSRDNRSQELENEMKRIRLGNLPGQAEGHRAVKPEAPPASFFVPFALIERSSQENGFAVGHGVHLIDRALPSLFGILRVMPGLLITVQNNAGNHLATTD